MAYPAEEEAGITYAELGIDTSRCRSLDKCFVFCPFCHHTRTKKENQRKPEMTININRGTMTCSHCGIATGLGKEARARGRKGENVTSNYRPSYRPVAQSISPETVTPVVAAALPDAALRGERADWVVAWHEERGIDAKTVDTFAVTGEQWKDEAGQLQQTINYPYTVDGELVNIKHRRLPKGFTQEPGSTRSLFNIDRAQGQARIIWVEGELDVLAFHMAGLVAVTTPDGAPGRIKNAAGETVGVAEVGAKLDALKEAKSKRVIDAAERIVIAVDDDMEGHKLRDGLIERLGPERCWVLEWPHGIKDATEFVAEFGAAELNAYLDNATPVDLPGVASFMNEWDSLIDIHGGNQDEGVSTGWPELDLRYRVRRGSVTVGTGIPGNGKTTFMLDMISRVCHEQDWRAAVFSPESGTNAALFSKLVQNVADAPVLPCDNQMDVPTLRSAAEWVSDHFWRVDAARSDDDDYQVITVPELIKRLESLVLRFGIQIAYVDPWNRLEASRPNGMTETEYVAWAINMFSRFARRHNVAVIIICHPHKMPEAVYGKDEPIPSPYNIAGSAHWYNMSDYVLGMGRAKYGDPTAQPPVPKNRLTVAVMKVREEITGDELGDTYFYYDGKSRRFYHDPEAIPATAGNRPYMPQPTLETVAAYANHEPIAAD